MEEQLKKLASQYFTKISSAKSLKQLDEIFLALFGKQGEITSLPKQFKDLPKDELIKIGPLFNKIKADLEETISNKRQEIREKGYKNLANESLDLAKTKLKSRQGRL